MRKHPNKNVDSDQASIGEAVPGRMAVVSLLALLLIALALLAIPATETADSRIAVSVNNDSSDDLTVESIGFPGKISKVRLSLPANRSGRGTSDQPSFFIAHDYFAHHMELGLSNGTSMTCEIELRKPFEDCMLKVVIGKGKTSCWCQQY